jgi:hypothetical protein
MEAKWPFMLITLCLIVSMGILISKLERTKVMNQWQTRRCELPVMTAASFFKPDEDPRSPSKFASENFSFCMKSYIDSFLALLMAPINALFSKQIGVTGSVLNILNIIRNLAQRLYSAFLEYLSGYFRKFNFAIFELSRIIQHLRMGVQRVSAIATSMIFMGITIFRGMLNAIQVVIRVVLIICVIMLIVIIILWFILFPVIPIIMATLTAVIAIVIALSVVLSGSIANDAQDKKKGFCFSENTILSTINNNTNNIKTSVKDIKVGDELGNGCGRVTAVIQMVGTDVELYDINDIYVSGSHVVQGTDGFWKEVKDDIRSNKTNNKSSIIYCFNTTSNKIPVYGMNDTILLFRDWEEIDNQDEKGQMLWNHFILTKLNEEIDNIKWKMDIGQSSEVPLVSKDYLVKTINGFLPISSIRLMDKIMSISGEEQIVLGIIYGEVDEVEEKSKWSTGLYEWIDGVWRKTKSTMSSGQNKVNGVYLITDKGDMILWDDSTKRERVVRDFTEIGHNRIHETYSFVSNRLRITEEKLLDYLKSNK